MINENAQMRQLILDMGFEDYRYGQLIESIFRRRTVEFEQMQLLPKTLRSALIERYGASICSVRPVVTEGSDQVQKTLLELKDGNRVESVALRYRRGWASYCISSQCGCGLGCAFCATGAMGFKRNLTAREITDQLLHFHLLGRELDSVSFMGMGEPLANPQTFEALSLLTDPEYFGLSQRKLTVSTVGIVPGIRRMTREFPQVNLAFSLHSPFDEQRSQIMPINRTYPLGEVMRALGEHIDRTRRKVFIAYMLIDRVNDTIDHAHAVAELLKRRRAYPHLYHMDLIRYNPAAGIALHFEAPTRERIKAFTDALRSAGVSVSMRAQFGADINAACGQLCGENGSRV